MRTATTTAMMWDSRSTTDEMMPARSGATTGDGRGGHIPIKGIIILMKMSCNMVQLPSHDSDIWWSHT